MRQCIMLPQPRHPAGSTSTHVTDYVLYYLHAAVVVGAQVHYRY